MLHLGKCEVCTVLQEVVTHLWQTPVAQLESHGKGHLQSVGQNFTQSLQCQSTEACHLRSCDGETTR